jgi:hypothetical protein
VVDERLIRIVTKPSEDGNSPGLVIYLNESGRATLTEHLAQLGPTDHHFHLEPYLRTDAATDVAWADVVLLDDAAPYYTADTTANRPRTELSGVR